MIKKLFVCIGMLLCLFSVQICAETAIHNGNITRPISALYKVTVNGETVPVRSEDIGGTQFEVAMFSFDQNASIEITAKNADRMKLSPTAYQIAASQAANKMQFTLDLPKYLLIEQASTPPILLLATPLETQIPDKNDPNVLYFEAGEHDAGVINLKSGQTLYLESGAVVHGRIEGVGVRNVKVLGRGIIEASVYSKRDDPNVKRTNGIYFENSKDCVIDGIGLRNTGGWQSLYISSKNFTVSNLNLMGTKVNNDGIDLDTVEDFNVENNFIMCGDDGFGWHTMYAKNTNEAPTRNIKANNNTIYNVTAGNAIRIGSSMETNLWENVEIYNTYILKAKSNAIMLDIQDWAWVKNFHIENVYVESAPSENVLLMHIVKGSYSNDVNDTPSYPKKDYRGHIQGVTVKNVQAEKGLGVVLKGFDDTHLVEDITLENINLSGNLITDISQIQTNAYVKNIKILSNQNYGMHETFAADLDAFKVQRGNWYVQNGKLCQQNGGGEVMITVNGSALSDCRVTATFNTAQSTASVGVLGRMQDHKNYYHARLNYATQAIELYKVQNGSLYLLASAPYTLAVNTDYVLQLNMQSAQLQCSVNGKAVLAIQDNSYASGMTGIRGYSWLRNQINTFTADDFIIQSY